MKVLYIRSQFAACALATLAVAWHAVAAEPAVVRLWEGEAPLAQGDSANDQPTITVFLAPEDKAVGTAVVLCPGGGYRGLATGHEGTDIARWFNERGISVFMLKYRLASHGYRHPAPLLDVQRAIRTVRSRASDWKIDPSRIGVMGFSAGGHLASTVATHFDAGNPNAEDPIEKASCRPDFAILCYPVIQFGSPNTHAGSQRNLLGENPSADLLESLSNEKQVTKDTPPTFLFHTDKDKAVVPENSVMFYLALRRAGVPAELHIYEQGPHGVGLAASVPGTRTWPARLEEWLANRGLLKKR